MQSPNPQHMKKQQKQTTYKGPLNRTQNPNQIERLQAQNSNHSGNPSYGGPNMSGGGGKVATSIDGIMPGSQGHHQISNAQLMHAGQ